MFSCLSLGFMCVFQKPCSHVLSSGFMCVWPVSCSHVGLQGLCACSRTHVRVPDSCSSRFGCISRVSCLFSSFLLISSELISSQFIASPSASSSPLWLPCQCLPFFLCGLCWPSVVCLVSADALVARMFALSDVGSRRPSDSVVCCVYRVVLCVYCVVLCVLLCWCVGVVRGVYFVVCVYACKVR